MTLDIAILLFALFFDFSLIFFKGFAVGEIGLVVKLVNGFAIERLVFAHTTILAAKLPDSPFTLAV